MDPISYTTVEQQLNKLTSQKLIIENISFARDALNTYGYSNLIKSYRDPYVITSDNKKVYRSDVTFDQIYSLYILDKNLRNAVMATMLDLEEYVKENAASVLAASFGTHQNDYLNYKETYRENYSDSTRRCSENFAIFRKCIYQTNCCYSHACSPRRCCTTNKHNVRWNWWL